MARQVKEDFLKLFYKYCRDNGLKGSDMKETIRSLDMSLSSPERSVFGESYQDDGSEERKRFLEFHHKLVQDCIDFINSNPGIKEKLDTRRKEIEEEWNKDLDNPKLFLSPDIRVEFHVDGLDGSLKEEKWSPCSDSYLGISLGNIGILESL